MEKDPTQVISFRVDEGVYGKLKVYAEAHTTTIGDVVRGLVEEFVAGGTQPSPDPQPSPTPGVPEELAALRKLFEELAQREENVEGYVGALGYRMNEVQVAVIKLWQMFWPGIPVPPWGPFGVPGREGSPGAGEPAIQDL
jgi:hypothetical protein